MTQRADAKIKQPDANEILRTLGADALREEIDRAPAPDSALRQKNGHAELAFEPQADRLRPYDLKQFLQLSIKPREMLLEPVLPEKGLAMLYGARGTGKTMVVLGLAYALATGTNYLKWKADKARKVLLVDGEMPAAALQERLSWYALGVNADPGDNLKILCGDLIEIGGVGNVGDAKIQAELEPYLNGIDLLILDNLSTLTAVIRDNDAESWGPIQEYLLRLRRRNISVLIVHHAGKGGQQRGTSRREDVLDTVICLRRPSDYEPTEGARFEVHIEKGRGMKGDDLKPFEAKFEVLDNAAVWTTREIEDAKLAEIKLLHDDYMSVSKIAEMVGMSRAQTYRLVKKIKAEGGDNDGE
jgi:putative DNA primase/helicase